MLIFCHQSKMAESSGDRELDELLSKINQELGFDLTEVSFNTENGLFVDFYIFLEILKNLVRLIYKMKIYVSKRMLLLRRVPSKTSVLSKKCTLMNRQLQCRLWVTFVTQMLYSSFAPI